MGLPQMRASFLFITILFFLNFAPKLEKINLNRQMSKVVTTLIMFLLTFDVEGTENTTYVLSQNVSTVEIREAETSAIQYSQRKQSRKRRRSRVKSSRHVNVEHVKDSVKMTKVVETLAVKSFLRVNLDTLTTDYVAQDGEVISGTLGSYQLTIADKATVTLEGVDITQIPNSPAYQFAGITCSGDATIILAKGTTSKVKGGYENYPGIYVPEGMTLTIKGSGTLESSSQGWASAIGGGKDLSCGNIVIEEGRIKAEGGKNAAAIGSGWFSSCGDITIQSAVEGVSLVLQKSGSSGIGAGKDASCGTVTIADSTKVTLK